MAKLMLNSSAASLILALTFSAQANDTSTAEPIAKTYTCGENKIDFRLNRVNSGHLWLKHDGETIVKYKGNRLNREAILKLTETFCETSQIDGLKDISSKSAPFISLSVSSLDGSRIAHIRNRMRSTNYEFKVDSIKINDTQEKRITVEEVAHFIKTGNLPPDIQMPTQNP